MSFRTGTSYSSSSMSEARRFRRAIVRPPAENFADGLTSVDLGTPDFGRALQQHEAYCEALEDLGLALTRLPEDPEFPDSTFVEDAAILAPRGPILTRPGAAEPRRRGRGHRRGPGVLLPRLRPRDRGPGDARRRRHLRGGGSLVHRDLAPDQRRGRAAARPFPRGGRRVLFPRRHPPDPRHPAPEERHRVALRSPARPHRFAPVGDRPSRGGTSSPSIRRRLMPPTASR